MKSEIPNLKSEISDFKFHRIGAGVALVLVPLMLLALPLPPTKGKWAVHKQDWILAGAVVIAAAALLIHLMRGRRGVLPVIVFGTALLLAANVTWNKAYHAYVSHHRDYSREVFRRAMHNTFHWPVYGRYDNALARADDAGRYSFATLPFALLSLLIAAGWFAWARRRPIERAWDWRSFAVLITFQLALIFSFALCEPKLERLTLRISGYNEFKKDMPRFTGVGDTLRRYVELMPTLEWYGQHYPPGNLILIEIEKSIGLPGMTKSIVVLLTALSVVPLYGLARELALSPVATTAAILMFAASSSVLILCTINTTSLLLFPSTMCLWMLARALKTGSAPAAVPVGLFFALYLMFSFSASILGVLMALTALIGWRMRAFSTRNLLKTTAISAGTLLAATALLYLTTHFNLFTCFVTAVRGHHEQQGNGGFDDPRRWLIRSTGNILAYALSTVPLCILALAAALRPPQEFAHPLARSLFIALIATILIAGFSGLFYVETERIWIFLTPFVALAAGFEAARAAERTGTGRRIIDLLILLVLAISCSQELFFMHYR